MKSSHIFKKRKQGDEETTIVQKLEVVLVFKTKKKLVTMCISGALLEMEKNFSKIRSKQIQNNVKFIDRKIMELQGNFSSMLGGYSRISYKNKLFYLNL